MRIDDCSEFRGHKLKNCSRCGHQFDALKLTRLNCDQLNAIKDKEWQFGFRWKLSDWAVGEVVKVDVCPSCYANIISLISAHEQIDKLTVGYASEHHKLPVYVDGEYQGEVYAEQYRVDMVDAVKYKNGIHINLEERKMKNVNETKNQNHAFAIERNYDETDRKLFRLEDAETGDFIRLATDEERLIYMVVNTDQIKSRIKVNEKSGVWCVCIQTQDLVELPLSEMVYVYDPRYIAFRIGRFIDS